MQRGPPCRSKVEQASKRNESHRAAEPKPERISIVCSRHPQPTRKLLFAESSRRKRPGQPKQQRNYSQNEPSAQQNENANGAEEKTHRHGRRIIHQKSGNSASQKQAREISPQAGEPPSKQSPPGNSG